MHRTIFNDIYRRSPPRHITYLDYGYVNNVMRECKAGIKLIRKL